MPVGGATGMIVIHGEESPTRQWPFSAYLAATALGVKDAVILADANAVKVLQSRLARLQRRA